VSRKPSREKRITTTLPYPVADWLSEAAERNFTTVDRFLREEIIRLFNADSQRIQATRKQLLMYSTPVVYFVRAGERGPIKAGVSSRFAERLPSLQGANADKLNILGVIPCVSRSDAFSLEYALKQRFAALQINGEWFRPEPELLTYIEVNAVDLDAVDNEPVADREHVASTRNAVTRSGYKGVYTYGKRWAAVVHEGGKQRRLGVYDTPEEAARAYDDALTARAGDPLAAVNFPTAQDQLREVSAPFVEKFATGQLTDIEWGTWQRETKDLTVPHTGPLPILPPSAGKPDPRAPLVDRPVKTLFRRRDDPKDSES